MESSDESKQEVEWPADVEISVEYCTRNPFHARFSPEKYLQYFNSIAGAFQERYPQTKIVGNPFVGQRAWKAGDKLGPLSDDVFYPRLGAFEVTVKCDRIGVRNIFSKLATRRWPNPRILVCQVERLLRGQELLKPVSRSQGQKHKILPHEELPGRDAVQVRRFPRQFEPRPGRTWRPDTSQRSQSAQPGASPRSPGSSSHSPVTARMEAARPQTSMSGRMDATMRTASTDDRAMSAPLDEPWLRGDNMSNDDHVFEDDLDEETTPAQPSQVPTTAIEVPEADNQGDKSAVDNDAGNNGAGENGAGDSSTVENSDAKPTKEYDEEGSDAYSNFEENATPSPKVWMPGAAAEEKWEGESRRNSAMPSDGGPDNVERKETLSSAKEEDDRFVGYTGSADEPLQIAAEPTPCSYSPLQVGAADNFKLSEQSIPANPCGGTLPDEYWLAQQATNGEPGARDGAAACDVNAPLLASYTEPHVEESCAAMQQQDNPSGLTEQIQPLAACPPTVANTNEHEIGDGPLAHAHMGTQQSEHNEHQWEEPFEEACVSQEDPRMHIADVPALQTNSSQDNPSEQTEQMQPLAAYPPAVANTNEHEIGDGPLAHAQMGTQQSEHNEHQWEEPFEEFCVLQADPRMHIANVPALQTNSSQDNPSGPTEQMQPLAAHPPAVANTNEHAIGDGPLAHAHMGMQQSELDEHQWEEPFEEVCVSQEDPRGHVADVPALQTHSSLVADAQESQEAVGGSMVHVSSGIQDSQFNEIHFEQSSQGSQSLQGNPSNTVVDMLATGAHPSMAMNAIEGGASGVASTVDLQAGTHIWQHDPSNQLADAPALQTSPSLVMGENNDEAVACDAMVNLPAGIQHSQPNELPCEQSVESAYYSLQGNTNRPIEGMPVLETCSSLVRTASEGDANATQSTAADFQSGMHQSHSSEPQWEEPFEGSLSLQENLIGQTADGPALTTSASLVTNTIQGEAGAQGSMANPQTSLEQAQFDEYPQQQPFQGDAAADQDVVILEPSTQRSQFQDSRWEDSFEGSQSLLDDPSRPTAQSSYEGSQSLLDDPMRPIADASTSQLGDGAQVNSSGGSAGVMASSNSEDGLVREVILEDETRVKSARKSSISDRRDVANIIAGTAIEEAVLFAADLPMFGHSYNEVAGRSASDDG